MSNIFYTSREISYQQAIINKPKTVITGSSSLSLDPSEYFYLIETRINTAKSLDDWKTVAALRAFKRNLNEKLSNRLREYQNQCFTR